MKTKELIRLLSDYAEIFDQNEGVIMGMHWTVDKKIQRLRIFGPTPRVVANWLAEYTATPIEEREDEKLYHIALTSIALTSIDSYKLFRAPFARMIIQHEKNDKRNTYITFTQSEIDNFPPEIKGAIEYGFLKKVEVEE